MHRLLQGHPVPGLPGAVRRRGRHARRRVASPASSSTPGRSGPSSAAPAASPTCWSRRTASSAGRSPRTSPTRSGPASPPTSGASPGDCIFFGAGAVKSSRALLGAARLEIGRRCGLIDESAWTLRLGRRRAAVRAQLPRRPPRGDVAVGGGAWTAVHHAFTSPEAGVLDTFDTDPGNALAYAYDIVCNGNEIGGGSIRIHREDVQKRVFEVMGLGAEEAQEKFGFLLDAFKYGAPPHGGIAFGWDRICALLAGTDSIRDVIAFPKSRRRLRPAHRGARRRSRRSSARRPASTPSPSRRRPTEPTEAMSDGGGLFDLPGGSPAPGQRVARRQHARVGAAAGADAAAHPRRARRSGAAARARLAAAAADRGGPGDLAAAVGPARARARPRSPASSASRPTAASSRSRRSRPA